MDTVVNLDSAISEREAEVLNALGEHLTNAQIAQKLHISVRTVESHVSSLLRKLGAADRRELALRSGVPPLWPTPVLDLTPDEPRVVGLPATWTTFVGRTAELAELSQALSVNRLVALLEEALGRKAIIQDVARPAADVEETWADVSAIGALTGFSPVTPLEVGIPRFASWFRTYHGA